VSCGRSVIAAAVSATSAGASAWVGLRMTNLPMIAHNMPLLSGPAGRPRQGPVLLSGLTSRSTDSRKEECFSSPPISAARLRSRAAGDQRPLSNCATPLSTWRTSSAVGVLDEGLGRGAKPGRAATVSPPRTAAS
jgi:hypothetical protein